MTPFIYIILFFEKYSSTKHISCGLALDFYPNRTWSVNNIVWWLKVEITVTIQVYQCVDHYVSIVTFSLSLMDLIPLEGGWVLLLSQSIVSCIWGWKWIIMVAYSMMRQFYRTNYTEINKWISNLYLETHTVVHFVEPV